MADENVGGTESMVKRVPKNLDDLAFASVREAGGTSSTRKISSIALDGINLERLKNRPDAEIRGELTEERRGLRRRRPTKKLQRKCVAVARVRGRQGPASERISHHWGAAGFETQMIEQDAQ